MSALLKSGAPENDVRMRAASIMAELRRKYAPMVGVANDADQAALLDTQIGIYQALLEVDAKLCSDFAIKGASVFSDRPVEGLVQERLMAQAVALFRAAASGMKAPTQRREAAEGDWTQVTMSMLAQGATTSQLEAVGSMNEGSADLCPGLILMMKAINGTDTEGAKAVRAQLLLMLVSG